MFRRGQGKSTKIDKKWPSRVRPEGGANQHLKVFEISVGGGGVTVGLKGADNQRAAKGGLDPSWVNLAFLGRPIFSPEVPKYLF